MRQLAVVRVAPWVVRRLSTEDSADEALRTSVRFLVPALARSGARVVVSEIETKEQLEWWRGIGAEFAQGPLFGEPASAQELTRTLSSHHPVVG